MLFIQVNQIMKKRLETCSILDERLNKLCYDYYKILSKLMKDCGILLQLHDMIWTTFMW